MALVFQNNTSHARFNEARVHLSAVRSSLRGVFSIILSSENPQWSPAQKRRFARDVARLSELLQVVGFLIFIQTVLCRVGSSTTID
jgi:hypothetical protein